MLPFSHGIPGLDVDKELTARSEAEVHRETVGDILIDGSLIMGVLGRNYTALGNYSKSFQK